MLCQKLLTKIEAERDLERSKRVELETEHGVLKSKLRKQKLISENERDALKVSVMTLENKYTNLKKEADDLRRSYNEVEESARLSKKKNGALHLKLSDANRKLKVFKEESQEAEKRTKDLERILFEKGLSASDEIDELQRKYEAECTRKKELERTIIDLRNTIDKLQLLQKKTHADYLKDVERDHAKYQSELDEYHVREIEMKDTIHSLEVRIKDIEFDAKVDSEAHKTKMEAYESTNRSLKRELETAKARYKDNLKEKDAKLFQLDSKIRRMESTSSDSKVKLETELEVFKKRMTNSTEAKVTLEADINNLQIALRNSKAEVHGLKNRLDAEVRRKLNLNDQLEKTIKVLNAAKESRQIEVDKRHALLTQLHEKDDLLDSLKRTHDDLSMSHDQKNDLILLSQNRHEERTERRSKPSAN